MSLQDSASRKSFVGALNMEYGLYALDCRMYSPAEENQGACFTNYQGEIRKEIPQFTGAYLDSERGTLKTAAQTTA